jgi:hypothetical protein
VKRTLLFLACITVAAPVFGAEKEGFQFKTEPSIGYIRPEKPVRIKLKRKQDGTYTWELAGDDAEKIMAVDRKLREYVNGIR